MFAILKKELRIYFLTPTGWIFIAVFLLISGLLFSLQNVFPQNPDYSSLLTGLLFIFLLVVPPLTMRIFIDEKKFNTDQLLLTGPTGLWSIVMGKYLAAFIVFLTTIVITFLYPILLSFHGSLEWPRIIGTYIGFILMGGAFISIGVFISHIAEGIVSAAILTFCALMVTFIIDFLPSSMPTTEVSGLIWAAILCLIPILWLQFNGKNWFVTTAVTLGMATILAVIWFVGPQLYSGLIGNSLSWLSLTRRFSSFALGLLRLDTLVYYLTFSGFFLFLTVQSLEKRRWS